MKTNLSRKQAQNQINTMTSAVLLPEGKPVAIETVKALLVNPWVKCQRESDGSLYVQAATAGYQVR